MRYVMNPSTALFMLLCVGLAACEPLSMVAPPVTAPPSDPQFYLKGKWGRILMDSIDHGSQVFPCAPFSPRSGHKYPFFQIENALVGQTSDLMTPKENRSAQVFNLWCGDSYGNMGDDHDVLLDKQIECPENTTLKVEILNPKPGGDKLVIGMLSGREQATEFEQDRPTRTRLVDGRVITMRTGTRVPKRLTASDVRRNTFYVNYLDETIDGLVPLPSLVHIVLSCR